MGKTNSEIKFTQINWQRDWLKLLIASLFNIGISLITAFLLPGWIGLFIGTVAGIGAYFLGLFVITKSFTQNICTKYGMNAVMKYVFTKHKPDEGAGIK